MFVQSDHPLISLISSPHMNCGHMRSMYLLLADKDVVRLIRCCKILYYEEKNHVKFSSRYNASTIFSNGHIIRSHILCLNWDVFESIKFNPRDWCHLKEIKLSSATCMDVFSSLHLTKSIH